MTGLLLAKCEKDGFPVTREYGAEVLQNEDFKLVAAIAAIKKDLLAREAAFKSTGRLAYPGYRQKIRRVNSFDPPFKAGTPDAEKIWCRDEQIAMLERHDEYYRSLSKRGLPKAMAEGKVHEDVSFLHYGTVFIY